MSRVEIAPPNYAQAADLIRYLTTPHPPNAVADVCRPVRLRMLLCRLVDEVPQRLEFLIRVKRHMPRLGLHYDVAPRYSRGEPGMVNGTVALGLAQAEACAYVALLKDIESDECKRACSIGLGRIAQVRCVTGSGPKLRWVAFDLLTGAVTRSADRSDLEHKGYVDGQLLVEQGSIAQVRPSDYRGRFFRRSLVGGGDGFEEYKPEPIRGVWDGFRADPDTRYSR